MHEDVQFMEKQSNVITFVEPDSIARELGIEPGDILMSINGQGVKDIIDFKYLICDEYIELGIQKEDGEEWVFEIEKDYDEDIGIEFKNPIIDRARSCANKCMFCFIDQLPKGMRETLYFKDDDSRLSFLQGNFITLTNMSNNDIDRIIRYRISPLNISVHTTDPELRIKMLGNKRAGNIVELLKKLTDSGIDINCQIVLCRDVNDGDNLKKTINDLFSFYPRVKNVAVVPVGITRYREGLYPLKPYDKESSGKVIDLIEDMQGKIKADSGDIFVRCADEFYIMADRNLPGPEYYGEYEQLEDGIGMITYFNENIKESLESLKDTKIEKKVSLVTGISPYKYILGACKEITDKIKGLSIDVYPVENRFFGGKITVTGLLTGRDIIEQLKGKDLKDLLLLPSNLLKSGEQVLLDGVTIGGLKNELNVDIRVCSPDGKDLIQKIIE